jgi:hypothetical protein
MVKRRFLVVCTLFVAIVAASLPAVSVQATEDQNCYHFVRNGLNNDTWVHFRLLQPAPPGNGYECFGRPGRLDLTNDGNPYHPPEITGWCGGNNHGSLGLFGLLPSGAEDHFSVTFGPGSTYYNFPSPRLPGPFYIVEWIQIDGWSGGTACPPVYVYL